MVLTVGTFQLGNCIGKGAFGVVYKGLNLEDGEIVAIKQISLDEATEIDSVMVRTVQSPRACAASHRRACSKKSRC